MQRTGTTSTTYTPSGKQKNAAHNAISLLQVMAIPQLRIDPIEKTVSDNFGGEVSIFINYMQASKEEMEGLRTTDVSCLIAFNLHMLLSVFGYSTGSCVALVTHKSDNVSLSISQKRSDWSI